MSRDERGKIIPPNLNCIKDKTDKNKVYFVPNQSLLNVLSVSGPEYVNNKFIEPKCSAEDIELVIGRKFQSVEDFANYALKQSRFNMKIKFDLK